MTATAELDAALTAAGFALELFGRLPDVVFFAKDAEGCYAAVNTTLLRRLGLTSSAEVFGRTTRDLFPPPLGERYLAQDLAVIRTGRPLDDLLELHLYPDRSEGWCVTCKLPIRAASGGIIGLVGISRDVRAPAAGTESLAGLAEVLRVVHEHLDQPLRVEHLAARAGMSAYQLTRRIRSLFGITPVQLIIKARLDVARTMLQEGDEPVGRIAVATGYCDQSAFTRQFKAAVGLTPAQYRDRSRPPRGR